MNKEFINCDTIRDDTLKLAHTMYTKDGFVPDIIYASLRGGAYMANVFSEYYKMVKLNRKNGRYSMRPSCSFLRVLAESNAGHGGR